MAYSKEYISTATATRILRQVDHLDSGAELVWTPAHTRLEGNQAVHEAARGLINRPTSNDDSDALFEPLLRSRTTIGCPEAAVPLRMHPSIEGCRWCGDSFRLTHLPHRPDIVTYIQTCSARNIKGVPHPISITRTPPARQAWHIFYGSALPIRLQRL